MPAGRVPGQREHGSDGRLPGSPVNDEGDRPGRQDGPRGDDEERPSPVAAVLALSLFDGLCGEEGTDPYGFRPAGDDLGHIEDDRIVKTVPVVDVRDAFLQVEDVRIEGVELPALRVDRVQCLGKILHREIAFAFYLSQHPHGGIVSLAGVRSVPVLRTSAVEVG